MMIHTMGPNSKTRLTNVQEGDVQPNACDLRLSKVFKIQPLLFRISEQVKQHRGSEEVIPDSDGWFYLPKGQYEVVMENIIEVGPDEAGWVITRSTLNRNGVFLTSGLYDSGYHGVMAACMHVTTYDLEIQKGTRIGQYVNVCAESLHKYNGSYGLNSNHDQKYK